ncbi:uncharacterized protein [Prorops nasuta]|uniref:uncharacterized protein n=1 Tax=Prorops nasuta TaxID=863751 RepID=UPI0034CD0DE9
MPLHQVSLLLFFVGLVVGQYEEQYPAPTPVPILKQINKHNEDGSYSYGFEAADGSYKIESKYPNGEVYGKYGFVDDTGNIREVEYGASKQRGFEPVGTGINVPPPTVRNNNVDEPEDDGQYREDPNIYHTDPRYTNGERYDIVPKPPTAYNPNHFQQIRQYRPFQQPQEQQQQLVPTTYRPALSYPTPSRYSQARSFENEYQPQFRTRYQPRFEGQLRRQQQPVEPRAFFGPSQIDPLNHASTSIDVNTGLASYTVRYRR